MPASDVLGELDAVHLLQRAAFGPLAGDVERMARQTREQAAAELVGKPLASAGAVGGRGKKGAKVKGASAQVGGGAGKVKSGAGKSAGKSGGKGGKKGGASAGRIRGPAGRNNDRSDLLDLQAWWLRRMASRTSRVAEKMVLFWHDHMPSSWDVVMNVGYLAEQNAALRQHALGSFRSLLVDVTRDAAMLEYLDGFRNHRWSPNENYGRELMELFTLGPLDANGAPNYTQQDVVEMARSLTGFRWDDWQRPRNIVVDNSAFDMGEKNLFAGKPFAVRGVLGVQRSGGDLFPEPRNVIDILFTHRDSDGRPTLARFLARKLWEWFAYPDPPLAVVDEVADAFAASGYLIRDAVFAILTHDEFYSDRARQALARTPVEFALQGLQLTGASTDMRPVAEAVAAMGMELLNPPGVNGWNHGEAWLSTSRFLARMEFAQELASSRERTDPYRYDVKGLLPRDVVMGDALVDALLARAHISVPSATRTALTKYIGRDAIEPERENWIERRLRGLLVLLMTLPEFQVS